MVTRQRFQAPSPGWYSFRTWVRRSTGENSSHVEVRCGHRTDRVEVPVAWPDQWLQVVVSFWAGKDSCELALRTRAAGGQWSNFDDITVEPGAPRLSILGADVSSLKKSEDFGGQYFDTRRQHPKHDGLAQASHLRSTSCRTMASTSCACASG